MMWKSILAASGVLSALVIVLSAALAMGGRDGETKPPSRNAVIEPDEGGSPDPSATGVIVARAGEQLYRFAPDGRILGYSGRPSGLASSASGVWYAYRACSGPDACGIALGRPTGDGHIEDLHLVSIGGAEAVSDGTWSPAADELAIVAADRSLWLVDAASMSAVRLGEGVSAYMWSAAGTLVFATFDGENSSLWTATAAGARFVSSLASPVTAFVPSPDGDRFAFLQDDADGWQLATVSSAGEMRVVANLGRVTSIPAATRAPDSAAISWSPDGVVIGVSPVARPFMMYLARSEGSAPVRWFRLREGYAGEMKWSPDGSRLAISTYSLDRKEHNVYVLDSMESNELRFLIDGCLIFWSPDGRFIVGKREPHDLGVAATRVSDGLSWTVTRIKMTPAAWGGDEESALKLAELPPRGIGGLLK